MFWPELNGNKMDEIEAKARTKINNLPEDPGWRFFYPDKFNGPSHYKPEGKPKECNPSTNCTCLATCIKAMDRTYSGNYQNSSLCRRYRATEISPANDELDASG